MIDLYGMSSPNVRKVLILLEELALPYRLCHVDLFGAQLDERLAALNPLGKVPVIVDPELAGGGQPIFESGAILIYLAEKHGRFLPSDGPARYEVLQWLMVQMANIGPIFGQHNHFSLVRAKSHPGEDAYAAERYRALAAGLYAQLDDRLAASPWLGGADYSIADMATWPWALYLERHGFGWDAHRHLARWQATIAERPAVARATAVFTPYQAIDRAGLEAASPVALARFFGREPPERVARRPAEG
jgi:GSH-dependent disulfide-bond oxidoreductase